METNETTEIQEKKPKSMKEVSKGILEAGGPDDMDPTANDDPKKTPTAPNTNPEDIANVPPLDGNPHDYLRK